MVDSIKICIPQHIKTNSTNIKTWISDVSYASTAVNSVKQATTTTAYANAVKNLSLRQAELALSTKNLTVEQQREILVTAGLIKETGTLTVAQATEALTTDTRNAADVEALMLKAGLITELGAETTATITVDAAKLKELVDTKVLTQAEAELLAMKAGVTLQSTKEAATLIASNAKLGSSFAIMGKTAGAALKGIGKGLLSFASAHPILAIGATIIGSVAFFNSELKKLKEEQEELISNAKALQEEYRNFTKDTSGKINSLTSQADEFNELSKGVDKYGNNISLASDEYDRYKSIVAEILGYSPELIQGYDAEGNAIADKNGLLERSIELLKEEQRLKLKEMTTDEKTGEAYDAAEAGWQQVQGYEGANTRNEIARWFDDNALRGGVNYEVDIAKVLGIKDEWKEEGNNLQNAIINNIDTVVKNIKDKKQELLAISDSDGNAIFSVDEIDNMIDLSNDWQYAYNQWQQDIEDAKHGMDDQFDLYAQRAKSYNDLTDAQKVFVNEYIRATGDITDAEGHLLSEDKILEKAKDYEKFVNEFAELNKLGEGGSVDLTFRPEIDTEELNKKGWEAGEGFATVFSSAISNTDFDDLMPENAEDTVAINFTPIIVDPNTGEFKGVLSEEELYAYAHDVLAGVREDDLNLQIGAKFEGKNAIDEAVADGERIHYLHEKLFINNDTVDSWEELRKVLVKTGDDAVQAGENTDKMTVSLSELESASDKIKTLGSAFKELSDDGYITTKTLGEIQTATGLSGDEWSEYESKLLNAKKGSAEFSQIMADLTYKMLDQTFANKDLNSLTEQQISAILRENGVVNADAVAHDWLTKAKETLRIKTALAKAGTTEEVVALATEASQAGITGNALNDLIMDMGIFNNTNLDVSQKVAALQEMGYYAHWTAQGLASIDKVKKYSFDRKDYIASYDKDGKLVGIEQEKQVEIPNVEIPKITIPNYSGVTSGGKGSGSGSDKSDKPDYEDPTEAIINRINLRSKELEQQEEYIQNALEIAEIEKDYEKQISLTNDLITTRKKRIEELNKANAGLHNEAEYLRNNNPYDEESWFDSQGEATEAYYSTYNSAKAKEEQEQIKDLFDKLSKYKKAYIDNAKEIVSLNKEILQDEEKLWDIRREIFDERLEQSEYYIKHSKDFGWENADNEIKARKRILEWIQSDYYRSLIKDDEEYYKILEEHRLNYKEALKDEFDKTNDFASTFLDSSKTLLQSYYDVTNSIAEAQHEINKELETSKTMYEWLDEDTRKLLFNQEDYNTLSEELYDIQYKADKLQRQYERDLENSTLNTIEEITSNYEMQYETLMKSYEIAKADLEIAKKKAKLNNVLNERNVRMFINGQWQWVANTEDVINAKSELADAEYAKRVEESGLKQQKSIDNLTKQQDELGTIINMFESGIIDLDTALQKVSQMFSSLPTAIEESFALIWGRTASSSSGKSETHSYSGISYDPNFDYSAAMKNVPEGSDAWNNMNRRRNAKILGEKLDYKPFATGTRYTPEGNLLLGEKEPEVFISNNGHYIPINQPTLGKFGSGGAVFNQDQMKSLRTLWDMSNLNLGVGSNFVGSIQPQQNSQTYDNRIIINGMTVDSGSTDGQALISALRRYVGNH